MKAFISTFVLIFVFLCGFNNLKSNEHKLISNNTIDIKVHVQDKEYNPVNGAYIRIDGPGIGTQCCTPTGSVCGFYTDTPGYFTICASKNGYSGNYYGYISASIDIDITITNTGYNCTECPQERSKH